jgi:hypothetical protein
MMIVVEVPGLSNGLLSRADFPSCERLVVNAALELAIENKLPDAKSVYSKVISRPITSAQEDKLIDDLVNIRREIINQSNEYGLNGSLDDFFVERIVGDKIYLKSLSTTEG